MAMGEKEMDDERMIIVKQHDNGKEIHIKSGDIIQVELEGLGSAGYEWYINDLDAEFLEIFSEETSAISEDKGKTGAPVTRIWRFRTKEKGHTWIRMDHYREWGGIEKAIEHFEIRVNIE